MSNHHFYKYQGTGNDFIMIDNRSAQINWSDEQIIRLCDRHFGIGSDGLILIQHSQEADFEMVFFNPDASKSFCGNGSRCAVAFAHKLKMIGNECRFVAIDGIHTGKILKNEAVEISVQDVQVIEQIKNDYFIHTGSPHYIRYTTDLEKINLINEAHLIRYNDRFSEKGTNVNFVQHEKDHIKVRTYERGVEAETLSCGSGVTACALSFAHQHNDLNKIKVITRGGELIVHFIQDQNKFSQISLTGPAQLVFKGEVDV